MTAAGYTSGIYGSLFSDPATDAFLCEDAEVRAMVHVEAALARVEARLGIIPPDAADEISRAAEKFIPDFAALDRGNALAGIPVVALVKQLRAQTQSDAAQYVHWGATSQDIMDSGLILRIGGVTRHFTHQLGALTGRLARLADQHRNTLVAARTRSQQALPTTFGLKVTAWHQPLVRHLERLGELSPRLLAVQFGGAAGTLAALGDNGIAVMEGLARELDLSIPATPWHTQRDGLAEFASWLSLVTGSLAKMAQDITLMAQTEIGELRESADMARGGSSTMPQKSNPIASETMLALARANAGHLATMHQALIQEHERGGPGWQMEWLTLGQMIAATGASLMHANRVAGSLHPDVERMAENLRASNGLLLAEAVVFALARHMPRPDAQDLVKKACAEALATRAHLVDVARKLSGVSLDWERLRDPSAYLGSTSELIDRALGKAGG